tara:strand:- start:93 stop:719 length:627 start_codon:yes stop_codon:yes gene_type:complete
MTFEKNIKTFNFNKDTMKMLVSDDNKQLEIVSMMNNVGFSEELTNFLLTVKPTFYNSIMLRLKLYAKKNKDIDSVRQGFSNFPETLFLVNHLYADEVENNSKVEETVETVEAVEAVEDVTSMIETDMVDVDSASEEDEDDPLDKFYTIHIKEESGSKLSTKESYEVFVNWFSENYQDEKPDKKVFKKYLSEKLGKSSKNSWKNYVLLA